MADVVSKKYRALRQHDHRYFEGCTREDPLPFSLDDFLVLVYSSIECGICPYCFGPLTLRNWSPDHMLALSRGGTSDLSNISIICWDCNNLKRSMTVDEFVEYLAGSPYPNLPSFADRLQALQDRLYADLLTRQQM